jgi:large subunit ribosomal protein L20
MPLDMKYSRFIHGLKTAGVDLNRKQLSEMAIQDPAAFEAVVTTAREALA